MAKTVIYLFYYHSLTLKTISFKTLKISHIQLVNANTLGKK